MCKPELVLCAVMMRCQTTFSVLRLLPVSNETPNPGGKGKTVSIYLIYQEYDCFKRTSCVHVRSVLCAAPDFALPELAVVGPTYVPSCRFSCTPGACFNHSNCRFLNKHPPLIAELADFQRSSPPLFKKKRRKGRDFALQRRRRWFNTHKQG